MDVESLSNCLLLWFRCMGCIVEDVMRKDEYNKLPN